MNGEDRQSVVESGDLVNLGAIEQMPPQWCGAGVADEARWNHEADSPARPDELKGTLNEELVQVDVGATLHPVDPGLTNEVGRLSRIEPPAGPGFFDAAVATDHVPRRVADD
jgi:hypothetical protein